MRWIVSGLALTREIGAGLVRHAVVRFVDDVILMLEHPARAATVPIAYERPPLLPAPPLQPHVPMPLNPRPLALHHRQIPARLPVDDHRRHVVAPLLGSVERDSQRRLI